MTVGNKHDLLGSYVSTTTGSAFVGKRVDKTWSGGDKTLSIPPRLTVVRPVVTYDSKGHKVYHWGRYRPPNRLPKRAYNEVHPYTCNWRTETTEVFSWSIDNRRTPWLDNSGTGTPATTWGGVATATPFNGWSSNDDLALLGKLRERVAGSDFNAGVFLGEGREALKMIANNATKIYKALIAVRKGRIWDAQKILTGKTRTVTSRGTVANNWLELQYGWLPLLSDVKGGAEFLSHHFTTPPVYRVAVAREVKFKDPCLPGSPSSVYFPVNRASCRGRIVALLKEKDVITLSGLTDPLSIAWELVPYSFVVDWFIPIGNYLHARGLAQALTGTFVTTKTNRTEVGGYVGKTIVDTVAPYDITDVKVNNAKYSMIHTTVNRTVSTSLSVPLPSVKPLGKVASWMHAANAVALLSQLKR